MDKRTNNPTAKQPTSQPNQPTSQPTIVTETETATALNSFLYSFFIVRESTRIKKKITNKIEKH